MAPTTEGIFFDATKRADERLCAGDCCLGMGQAPPQRKQRSSEGAEASLGDRSNWLQGRLDVYLGRLCKTVPIAHGYSVPSTFVPLSFWPVVPPVLPSSKEFVAVFGRHPLFAQC